MNLGESIIAILFIGLIIFGLCALVNYSHTASNTLQFYNNNDKNDFGVYNDVLQFKVCQLKQITNLIKESHSSGGWFLFVGGFSSSQTESKQFNYYTYVKDQNGGIYFMQIPSDKVRIYQDSKNGEIVICAQSKHKNSTNRNFMADVDNYFWFNIHIPEGTIIQKIDKIDIDNFVKKGE